MDQVAGGVHAAIQIDGGEYGFRGVRQNGWTLPPAALLLASAQQQMAAQLQRLRHLIEAVLTDKRGADAGQIALRQVGVLPVQVLGGDKAQHRVPQKLQPLVAGDMLSPVLVGIGAVVQRPLQQRRVTEGVAQLLL